MDTHTNRFTRLGMHPDVSRDELERFTRMIHALPCVRVDRVVTIRKALHENRYDTGDAINGTVRRIRESLERKRSGNGRGACPQDGPGGRLRM